jgi:hypothetical protein
MAAWIAKIATMFRAQAPQASSLFTIRKIMSLIPRRLSQAGLSFDQAGNLARADIGHHIHIQGRSG